MSDLVGDYLAELRMGLPGPLRRDVVAEIEDHLRESASANGAAEAVARFGPARDLAFSFARRVAVRDTRRAALLLLLATFPLAVATCPFPRGLLPAWGASSLDGWIEQVPAASLQDAILVLLCVSGALVLSGIVVAESRRPQIGLLLQTFALLSIIALGVTVTVLATRWGGALPSAPSPMWIAVYVLTAGTALTGAGKLGLRAATACVATRRLGSLRRAGRLGDLP
jgi:hypothetical protein